MRVPHTIPQHVLEAYRCSIETRQLREETDRTIQSENDKWDEYVIPDLTILALKVIVRNWPANPILESLPTPTDRDMLIEMLPTDLPFDLIIKNIPFEHYWKRVAQSRWEFCDISEHGHSWRQLYCERHLNEYLQQLDPKGCEADSNEYDELIELLKEYVFTVRIRSLVPNKIEFQAPEEDDDEDFCTMEKLPVHHIPFNLILPKLTHLREVCINIGMIYMDDGFEWRDFEFSVEDCFNLGSGIKECPSLRKFSLTRSNLDQPRVAALLQKIVSSGNIEEIDFSHCTLNNGGALAISGFLMLHNGLRVLNLTNNNIGPEGFAGLVAAITSRKPSSLKELNLRLNPLNDESGKHICTLLREHPGLVYLNVSSCSLGPAVGMNIVGMISTVNSRAQTLKLDVSNNDFDLEVRKALELASESCAVIIEFDGRIFRFV